MASAFRESVLICDDEVDVTVALKAALSDTFDVYVAHRVETAKDMLQLNSAKPKVEEKYTAVIIDLAFDPKDSGLNEDGFSILKVAIDDPYIEPIIFTGTGDEGKVIRAMNLCAFKYIAKNKRQPQASCADLQLKTMSDVEQVVHAVKSASKMRAAILALDNISPGRALPYHEAVHLKRCLLRLRRPIWDPNP